MNIQKLFADRIGGESFGQRTAIYKFEKIKRAKRAAQEAHPDVEMLDFGVGEPDQMAPRVIRQTLKKAVDEPGNRGYADNGILLFQQAAAAYMADFFGVTDLEPATEINHTIGSKPALAMLPLCFVNPGDSVLATIPGYPVLATHTRYLGATVLPVPLSARNKFFPDLKALEQTDLSRVKLFYVNYPNNPTGAAATEDFFDELIAFANRHNILIVQDAAYATLVYGRERLSILSRPGGKDAAIELHSMSKSYNMTGWRLGFVAGGARAVKAVAEVKDNIDSGQFKAIQVAACAGIADIRLAEKIRIHYQRRLRGLVKALKAAGFKARMPGGTFYLYVAAPKGTADGLVFANAEEASQYLIREHSISTVPWDDAGAYLRFGATFESEGPKDDHRVLAELERRLTAARFVF
ncbi:MAG: LL-diaminopimelate aminotransferase [Verrucomicrobiota bacterium]|jgi:LL-diaminopimelate aminotransferase|nr:LL-diaminopimelate aminotransferase [Verrucomicrobiota bacterium]